LFALLAFCSSAAFAAEEAAPAAAVAGSTGVFVWSIIVAGLALAVAACACGLAQGMAVQKGLDGIARQPEATGQIQTAMVLGLAFIESLVIYVLLIALILLFVNPFVKYFIK
jgi:F-type H+-transporting ATPase subunit c